MSPVTGFDDRKNIVFLEDSDPAELSEISPVGLAARFSGLAVSLLAGGPGKVCETQAECSPKIGTGSFRDVRRFRVAVFDPS